MNFAEYFTVQLEVSVVEINSGCNDGNVCENCYL